MTSNKVPCYVLWGFLGSLVTLQSGIRYTRCTGEVEHPPGPILQEVVLGTVCHVEENRLRSREVAAEKGLSMTTWREAAARSARSSDGGGSKCPTH